MRKFIDDNFGIIGLIGVILGVLLTIFFFLYDAEQPIDAQKESLYQKEAAFGCELSNLEDMTDGAVTISEDSIYVVFEEEDCKMNLLYDKDWNLKSKEIEDKRIGAELSLLLLAAFLFGVGGGSIGTAIVCLLLSGISYVVECVIEKIREKKSKQAEANEEDIAENTD